MIRTHATILLLLLLHRVSFGQPQTGDSKPIETTLCEVVKHSVRFAGKRVRFHAYFESGGLENSVKRVVATFMGRFLLKGQRRILELQEIGDLEVTPSAKTRR
jgi:hypothetical protein